MITYPISDSSLSFADYIAATRTMIRERRPDLQLPNPNAEIILDANSPFELMPANPIRSGEKLKYGLLMVHGLLDCPFSVRDIGVHLKNQGILCRSILLPGHGTIPNDLLNISYQEWIQAVKYGIESLQKEVEKIYLLGYSTGATLSAYHALKNYPIAGIILLAPAIKIKAPVNLLLDWHALMKFFRNHREWLYQDNEIDYAKYLSIPFNAIRQVSLLTHDLVKLHRAHHLDCPIFMAVSHEDETISSHTAIDFFSSLHNEKSRLLVYTSYVHKYTDSRISTRLTPNSELGIKHFSHVSIPFTANNSHYGQHGDYAYASLIADTDYYYFGAYNNLEVRLFDLLYMTGITKRRRRELTYNPDFDFMAEQISEFILN